ncbi:AAA family ATPase [Mesobacillus sp. AQ2]|uniref:AAA family ATPase n=1 Tax=Mesobacillus sp. AQ2 TaxID=3043332 RepID=UPI0024C1C4C9|nr:AAA family ATPase [Mesobacillus sp. AQ2]WHX41184.1 AAA family ATPase [Mesobacillus sp. AQ2]
MKLKKVVINKYKSFITEQVVDIESSITRLVGKNESGKTSFLEALAKFNYFESDPTFEFNDTFDFPKNEWKNFQKSGEDVEVVKCTFLLDEELIEKINDDIGEGVLSSKEVSYGVKYKNGNTFYLAANEKKYISTLLQKYDFAEELMKELDRANTVRELIELCKQNEDANSLLAYLNETIIPNAFDWKNLIQGYVAKHYIKPNLPKFWYFDEYYSIPSRISLNKMINEQTDAEFTKEEFNTAKALFELANIDIDELKDADSFEAFISELEATSNAITDEFLEYWTTNTNLEIKFEIEPLIQKNGNNQIVREDKILNIRIRNTKHRVSLPLKNRSKGFIWFFSFLVWFSKIQNANNGKYILLLDEPGLNLHASAQGDLLKFIEEKLSNNYQVIYTTHSPFMIDTTRLHEVRTVFDSMDPKKGSLISDAIEEKDSDTLFPLQAALGYDIAQNLYMSKNNLLVEGPADLLYITVMSGVLESNGRVGLANNITIVPVGGLDKVSSFISLLRGSKLNVVCLLDSFTDQKGKKKVEDLIMHRIIKEKNIRFFDEFSSIEGNYSDIEDLFEKEEYIKFFNLAFHEYDDIKNEHLDPNTSQIIKQINKVIGKTRFNHYRPAYKLTQLGVSTNDFSGETLDRFENMFKEINKLFL